MSGRITEQELSIPLINKINSISNNDLASNTWNSRVSAANNDWNSICYGNGIFVVGASTGNNNGAIMTSYDGIVWNTGYAPMTSLRSIVYNNGLFVAVGGSSNVATSTDGVNWTLRTGATNNIWNSVCYGKGILVDGLELYVAVSSTGTNNRVMTSPDGINWTSRLSAANNSWNSVCYGNGVFVAVAYTGSGAANRVMTSPDGINWTSRVSFAVDWISVVYGGGIFVAVGNNGVMTSTNGIDWTLRTGAVNNIWTSVCYGNGIFVAVSSSGTGDRVMTSTNGIDWISKTSATDNDWVGICYRDDIFVAVSSSGSGNRIMTSGICKYVENTSFEILGKIKGIDGTGSGIDSDLLDGKHAPSGTIVGTTDTQTLTNKSLQDSTTLIINNSDITKKVKFDVSGVTTGNTRTLTIPNNNGTIFTNVVGGTPNNILTRDASGIPIDSGKGFNDSGTTTSDIWSAYKVQSIINNSGGGNVTSNDTESIDGQIIIESGTTGKIIKKSSASIDINGQMLTSSLGLGTSPVFLLNSPLAINGNVAGYVQANIQNFNSGADSSADFVVTADIGSDIANYIDLGINSSAYNDADFNIAGVLDGYLYTSDGHLAIGTASSTKHLKFFTSGTLIANERMRITDGGILIPSTSSIIDANSNELIKFSATTSAVNEITIKNNITLNAPEIQATGNDTNIGINLVTKGTGAVTVNGNPIAASIPLYDTTGIADTYIATPSPAISALTDGLTFRIRINVDSTGASTLNVSGKGVRAIKKANGDDFKLLKAGGIYTLTYNGNSTNFIVQGDAYETDCRVTSNSGNDYSMTSYIGSTPVFGIPYKVMVNASATSSVRLRLGSSGTYYNVKYPNGNNVSDWKANGIYTLIYNNTDWILQGGGEPKPIEYVVSTFSAPTYYVTILGVSSLTAGMVIRFKAANHNRSGSNGVQNQVSQPTYINVNSLGDIAIQLDGYTLSFGAIRKDCVYSIIYDGTYWNLISPSSISTPSWRGISHYVSPSLGNDATADGTINYPFSTIQRAVDMLPKSDIGYSDSYHSIVLMAGTYANGGFAWNNQSAYIHGFNNCKGVKFSKNGSDVVDMQCQMDCYDSVAVIKFSGLSWSGTGYGNAVQANNCHNIYVDTCSSTGVGGGFQFENSNVKVISCTISNKSSAAISAYNNSKIRSSYNNGSGNSVGLNATGGSVIAKEGTQPSATTLESASSGGVIR